MGSTACSTTAALLGACLFAAAAPALAQAEAPARDMLTDRFVFTVGGFLVGTDVRANLNGQSRANPDVDFDETFGSASDNSRGRVDAMWRITPNHHLRAMYFNNKTTRNRVIDRDIAWGDVTYRAGGNVESQIKLEVSEVDYEWAFLHQPTYEVAASFGVHYSKLSLQLAGTASVFDQNGNVTTTTFVSKTNSLPAPLPVLGIRGSWAVAPNVLLDAQVQYFRVSVDGYDGNWSDARAGATWMFTRHFGAGLGYDHFATRVRVERPGFNGRLRVGYGGLQAFVTGTF
jgi:hypothetical protein